MWLSSSSIRNPPLSPNANYPSQRLQQETPVQNHQRVLNAPPWSQHGWTATTKGWYKSTAALQVPSQAINSRLVASPRTNLPTQLSQLLADFAIASWLDARACSNFIPTFGGADAWLRWLLLSPLLRSNAVRKLWPFGPVPESCILPATKSYILPLGRSPINSFLSINYVDTVGLICELHRRTVKQCVKRF